MHLTSGRNVKFWGDNVNYYNMVSLRDKIEELQDKDPTAWMSMKFLSEYNPVFY